MHRKPQPDAGVPRARLSSLWRAVRSRWTTEAPAGQLVTLQHLGLSNDELQALRPVLRSLGEHLGLRLDLQRTFGDVVLVSQAFAQDVPQAILASWCEDRPLVSVQALPTGRDAGETTEQVLAEREQELRQQLQCLPLVQRASARWQREGWSQPLDEPQRFVPPPESAYDPQFDTRTHAGDLVAPPLDLGQQAMVNALLRRLHDQSAGALRLSFGPRAHIRLDFDTQVVLIDPLALQMLRVRREVPLLCDAAQPGDEATARELGEVVWDLGVACGSYRLVGEPADWWHTPVEGLRLSLVAQCTRLPRHLELARLLADGACTPAELRRQARTSVNDVRRFLQAGLFLGLLYWAPWSRPDASGSLAADHAVPPAGEPKA